MHDDQSGWVCIFNESVRTFRVRDRSQRRFWFLESRASTGITDTKSNTRARGCGESRLFENLLWKPSTEWNCTTRAVAISNSGIEHGTWLSALPDQWLTPTTACMCMYLSKPNNKNLEFAGDTRSADIMRENRYTLHRLERKPSYAYPCKFFIASFHNCKIDLQILIWFLNEFYIVILYIF